MVVVRVLVVRLDVVVLVVVRGSVTELFVRLCIVVVASVIGELSELVLFGSPVSSWLVVIAVVGPETTIRVRVRAYMGRGPQHFLKG